MRLTHWGLWPEEPVNSEDYYGYLVNYKFSNTDWKYDKWFDIWNTVANFELDLKKYILSTYGEIEVTCRDGVVRKLVIDYNRKQVGCMKDITAETGVVWVDLPLNIDYVVQILVSRSGLPLK